MASNNAQTPADGNTLPENITLRVVILAHGNRAEDDLFLVLSLDTTIDQLKLRIQESFSQHPPPENQRLIYQGRGLDVGNSSLRQILRVDQRAGSAAHVIHLVVRDPITAHAPPHVPVPNAQQQPFPHHHGARPISAGPNVHQALHERLHNMQHQLHHAQALRASQPGMYPQQPVGVRPAGQTPPNMPPPNFGHPPPTGTSIRIEERVGPNGEHVRTVIDSNGSSRSTTMTFQMGGLNVPDPINRPSSAPGSSPPSNTDPANRAAEQMPRNIHVHAPIPHIPAGFPFPPGMQLPPPIPSMFAPAMQNIVRPPPAQTMAWLLSSPNGPQGIVLAPGHGFFTTLQSSTQAEAPRLQPTPTMPLPSSTPTATRPQAELVVRPQDGLAEVVRPDPAPPQPGAVPQAPQPAPAVPARRQQRPRFEDNDLVQWFIARAWLFMRMYMFIFVFSESGSWRRLVLLTSAIVFCLLPDNNPLTDAFNMARRHFDNLIGPPNILPRPAQPQDQVQVQNAPNRQANGQENSPQTQAATTPTGTRRQQAPMSTPEEAARRLLQQQNRRNPNPVLDFLYRIEQGVVLFLASLIPGLGERHVQARAQARQILEEEERRGREERERQNADGQPVTTADGGSSSEQKRETGPLPESWGSPATTNTSVDQASSSGIDRGAGHDDGLRARDGT